MGEEEGEGCTRKQCSFVLKGFSYTEVRRDSGFKRAAKKRRGVNGVRLSATAALLVVWKICIRK